MHFVLQMLKSEALGYLEKVQHCGVQDIQEIFPDQALAAQLLSHTDMGFVSSIALTDSSIFVAAGCGHLQILSKNPCKSQADTVPKPYRVRVISYMQTACDSTYSCVLSFCKTQRSTCELFVT